MTEINVIETLKREAHINKAANAVFHVFALRERTAYQVTLSALIQKMKTQGFNFEQDEYSKLLRLLSSLGFGRLEVSNTGKVKALREVKVTLQSIGKAALGEESIIQQSKPRHKFIKLVPRPKALEPKQPVEPTKEDEQNMSQVGLTVSINGKPVKIEIPKNFTAQEIVGLVNAFHNKLTG